MFLSMIANINLLILTVYANVVIYFFALCLVISSTACFEGMNQNQCLWLSY